MTDIDSLAGELTEFSEEVLSDLSSEERVQAFAREAAAGNDKFPKKFNETAPEFDYTAQDLDYFIDINKLLAVSLQARFEPQTRYQNIMEAGTRRIMYIALFILNQSLCRLSRGGFDMDDGQVEAPTRCDARSTNGYGLSGTMAYLINKYPSLWKESPHILLRL